MEFFSVILNYNKTNDYLINSNCDPLLTSSSLTVDEFADEFFPKLQNSDLPCDEINYQSLNVIEEPYESLLSQLNPVDLSPNPYIADDPVLEQRITINRENDQQYICYPDSNGYKYEEDNDNDDDDDYPNDQLIIDCLLEDSCDIGDLCDLDDANKPQKEDDDDDQKMVNTTGNTSDSGYFHDGDGGKSDSFEMRIDQMDINDHHEIDDKQDIQLQLADNIGNQGIDNNDYLIGSKSGEKENEAPNVYKGYNLTQYIPNNQLVPIEFPTGMDTFKRESNQEIAINTQESPTFNHQQNNNISVTGHLTCALVAYQSSFTHLPNEHSSISSPIVSSSSSSSSSSSMITCCRKHEKYYRKLLNRKTDRPIRERMLVVQYLYIPLDNRTGSYLKPKFSHNILCAFAILCGSDEDMMIEVSGIYRFLW